MSKWIPKGVGQIVDHWLYENDFDGLANPDVECGCLLGDHDACPNLTPWNCQPAYVIEPCAGCPEDCDWANALSTIKGFVPDCERMRKEQGDGSEAE